MIVDLASSPTVAAALAAPWGDRQWTRLRTSHVRSSIRQCHWSQQRRILGVSCTEGQGAQSGALVGGLAVAAAALAARLRLQQKAFVRGKRCSRRAVGTDFLVEGTDLRASHDGLRTLFRLKELKLNRGQKLAVVGANGTGKSTLLAALAGKIDLASGSFRRAPDLKLAVVEQRSNFNPDDTVIDTVFKNAWSPQARASWQYRRADAAKDAKAVEEALAQMEATDAWTWEETARDTMAQLGLDVELQARPMSSLSGGQERRVALAAALVNLEEIDILILDEPTNHLSVEGCDWLQKKLQAANNMALVLVTHDRYFMDEICTSILEIDGLGEAYMYMETGWAGFQRQRAERIAKRASDVQDAKVQLRRAKEWLNRGASGRGTKNKAQIKAYYDTEAKTKAVVDADNSAPELRQAIEAGRAAGGQRSRFFGRIALVDAIVKQGDQIIIDSATLEFERGSKVGVIGPNGAGKSTLLKALSGEIQLASGEVVMGDDVRIGFLTQDAPVWPDPSKRVRDFVSEMADIAALQDMKLLGKTSASTRESAAVKMLKSVNFARNKWDVSLESLSGGEARRLQLLQILAERPSILLMDEPTNDLDAVTVDAVEQLLQEWPGTVILVSHDRALLDGVCSQLVVFPAREQRGKLVVWNGDYASYVEEKGERTQESAKPLKPDAAAGQTWKKARQVAHREIAAQKRKFKNVEKSIELKEAQLEKLEEEMASLVQDYQKLGELNAKYGRLVEERDALYEEWEQLAEALS